MEFKEMNEKEMMEIDGGVSEIVVLGIVAVVGLAAGYGFGYVFG